MTPVASTLTHPQPSLPTLCGTSSNRPPLSPGRALGSLATAQHNYGHSATLSSSKRSAYQLFEDQAFFHLENSSVPSLTSPTTLFQMLNTPVLLPGPPHSQGGTQRPCNQTCQE